MTCRTFGERHVSEYWSMHCIPFLNALKIKKLKYSPFAGAGPPPPGSSDSVNLCPRREFYSRGTFHDFLHFVFARQLFPVPPAGSLFFAATLRPRATCEGIYYFGKRAKRQWRTTKIFGEEKCLSECLKTPGELRSHLQTASTCFFELGIPLVPSRDIRGGRRSKQESRYPRSLQMSS